MKSLLHLNPALAIHPLSEGVVLHASDGFQIATDPIHQSVVLTLADSPMSLRELGQTLREECDQQQFHRALHDLERAGALQKGPEGLAPAALQRWEELGIEFSLAALAIARPLAVVSEDPRNAIIQEARRWGFRCEVGSDNLRVVVAADPLSEVVHEENLRALNTDASLLFIAPRQEGIWLTLLRPGRTACARCLTARLQYNEPARRLTHSSNDPTRVISEVVAGVACRQIARLLALGEAPEIENRWTRWDSRTGEMAAAHPLDRLCHCSACGTSIPSKSSPLENVSFISLDYRRLIDPVTGIARGLQFLDTIDGAAVSTIRHRFAMRPTSIEDLKLNEQHMAGGKGWTPEEAAMSACGEAVGRISGWYRETLAMCTTSAHELGEAAILPNQVDLFSERQLGQPSPSEELSMLTAPRPLDPSTQTRWVRAWPIDGGGEPRWFPAGAAFYGYPFEGPRFALATSNGCAAGPTPTDAAIGGLLELIERDAAAIWWYNRIQRPAIPLEGLHDERLEVAERSLGEWNRTLDVLDITTDLGIPAVVAVSRRASGLPGWTLGFGAGFSYRQATLRAVAELAQLVAPTDNVVQENPVPWSDEASAEEHPQLRPSCAQDVSEPDLEPTLNTLSDSLSGAGLEAFAVEQTHALIGVPVLRIIAPGLVHFWRRLGAERLHQVPVEMGWLERPRTEEGMNELDLLL